MSSVGARSLPNDPQARRDLATAMQPHRLGASLELDTRGYPQVKPATKVRRIDVQKDLAGLNTKVAQLATGATLPDTVTKAQELVTAVAALVLKVNELLAAQNRDRAAFEKHSAALVDSLTRGGIMEK